MVRWYRSLSVFPSIVSVSVGPRKVYSSYLCTTGGEDGDGRRENKGRKEEERRTRRGVIVCKCLLSFDTVTLSSADNTNYNCTTTAQFPPQLSTNTHIQTPYRHLQALLQRHTLTRVLYRNRFRVVPLGPQRVGRRRGTHVHHPRCGRYASAQGGT